MHATQSSAIEQKCQALVGLTLQKVFYTEADLFPAHPQSCHQTGLPLLHTVDFSVTFVSVNQQTVTISWREMHSAYALSVETAPQEQRSGQCLWEVSGEGLWQPCIGQTIGAVNLHWRTGLIDLRSKHPAAFNYLQSLTLRFGNQTEIFISAAEWKSEHCIREGTDNLLITSNRQLLQSEASSRMDVDYPLH